MNDAKLTAIGAAATTKLKDRRGRAMRNTGFKAGLAALGTMALGGCINIAAPEEPIVIELNVNIRAEVLYRLAEDANNTIEENADIF